MTAAKRIASIFFLFAALIFLFDSPAGATIRRVPGAWLWGPKAVWTDGTATPMFHPFSDAIDTGTITFARVSLEMDQNTGNCKIRSALRYSSDGISWDSPVAINSSYRTTPGIDYGTIWVDLTSLATSKNFVQFGIQAANNAGSNIETCNATLMVQPRIRN